MKYRPIRRAGRLCTVEECYARAARGSRRCAQHRDMRNDVEQGTKPLRQAMNRYADAARARLVMTCKCSPESKAAALAQIERDRVRRDFSL